MSIGRAYEELSDYGLTGIDVKGRQKFLVLEEQPRHLLERAQDLLRTPVQSTKLVRCNLKIPPMKIAGESALSNLTELSPPEIPVYALHASEWKAAAGDYIELVTSDDANAIVEVWHYRPDVLTDYATVDPLSLYAQFWNHPNERVAKSAKELLEHVQW